MEKKIIKGALRALAKAPAEAMKNYIESLPPNDAAEAERLATALGIKIKKEDTDDEQRFNGI